MAGGMQGQSSYAPGQQPQHEKQGSSESGVTGAMSDMANRASEMWDDAYDQGARYYREGTRAVSNVDGTSISMLLLGGALGYAIAWMVHGEGSNQRRELPDYARTRAGYGRDSRHLR